MQRIGRVWFALLAAVLIALGCAAPPPAGDGPVVTFESSEADRAKARATGEPVLVRGVAARFPLGGPATGWADVSFVVRRDGTVSDVRIGETSNPIFGEPAAEAVAAWLFEPSDTDRKVTKRYFFTARPADHYQPTGDER